MLQLWLIQMNHNVVPRRTSFFYFDFNAQHLETCTWKDVYGVENKNSNGSLLLSICLLHQLTNTNTLFQQQISLRQLAGTQDRNNVI